MECSVHLFKLPGLNRYIQHRSLLWGRFFSERSELEEGLRHCSVHALQCRAKQCTVWPCWPPISDRSFLSLAFGLEYSLIHLSERGYNMTCEVVFQAQVETLNFHFRWNTGLELLQGTSFVTWPISSTFPPQGWCWLNNQKVGFWIYLLENFNFV